MSNVEKFLEENAEKEFAEFQRKLIFSSHKILGVRTPILRKFAKTISPKDIALSKNCSHEEILLFGFASSRQKGQLQALKTLLPQIDNWATCDMIVPALKELNCNEGYNFFMNLLLSKREFYVRVGLIGLMKNFLNTPKLPKILEQIKSIQCDKYYVNMAIAWLYSELCTTNFKEAKKQIADCQNAFIKQKAISKACESFRVSPQQKVELKLLLKK